MSSSESVPDLTPEKTAILVELQALSHTVAEVSKSLDELLQLTSPGGPLHDKQQKVGSHAI